MLLTRSYMARFQAKTNSVLDAELEELRRQLGLRSNQKADLLRELTAIASWVVHQASEGRIVLARGDEGESRELEHPAVERIRKRSVTHPSTLHLTEDEVRELAAVLNRPFEPPAALRESLRNLADPERAAPRLSWPDEPA